MTQPQPFSVKTRAEIYEDRIRALIRGELSDLVDEGLLNMSVDPATGEIVFWATPAGEKALGMSAEPEGTVANA